MNKALGHYSKTDAKLGDPSKNAGPKFKMQIECLLCSAKIQTSNSVNFWCSNHVMRPRAICWCHLRILDDRELPHSCDVFICVVCKQNGGALSAQQYRPMTSARQHGWQTYQTLAAPYPGYLLHFLYVTHFQFCTFLPRDALRCKVFVIVILSVCHTRGLCPHGSTYDHDFFTIW